MAIHMTKYQIFRPCARKLFTTFTFNLPPPTAIVDLLFEHVSTLIYLATEYNRFKVVKLLWSYTDERITLLCSQT